MDGRSVDQDQQVHRTQQGFELRIHQQHRHAFGLAVDHTAPPAPAQRGGTLGEPVALVARQHQSKPGPGQGRYLVEILWRRRWTANAGGGWSGGNCHLSIIERTF
jgi:hypothetical protein